MDQEDNAQLFSLFCLYSASHQFFRIILEFVYTLDLNTALITRLFCQLCQFTVGKTIMLFCNQLWPLIVCNRFSLLWLPFSVSIEWSVLKPWNIRCRTLGQDGGSRLVQQSWRLLYPAHLYHQPLTNWEQHKVMVFSQW